MTELEESNFNMTGYTKLFGSIVDSTIWRESKETKIVWITMLAKANRDGIVEASLPGLADAARVSIEECQLSLKCLMSPDEYSRTKDFEGRRIEETDGGWKILNHAKYRAKMNADERREYFARKKREYRAQSKKCPQMSNSVLMTGISSTHAEAKAEAYTEASTSTYSPESRVALHYLNEKSGKHFRETAENLGFIQARLREPEVTIAGIKLMIDRQCRRWLNTSQAEYLRPQTLFNHTKFDSYYAAKDQPINDNASSPAKPEPKSLFMKNMERIQREIAEERV
jgi:uncharacterized phage protein (TIGR02220 family)